MSFILSPWVLFFISLPEADLGIKPHDIRFNRMKRLSNINQGIRKASSDKIIDEKNF